MTAAGETTDIAGMARYPEKADVRTDIAIHAAGDTDRDRHLAPGNGLHGGDHDPRLAIPGDIVMTTEATGDHHTDPAIESETATAEVTATGVQGDITARGSRSGTRRDLVEPRKRSNLLELAGLVVN